MTLALWIGGGVLAFGGLVLAGWALFGDRSRARRCRRCWYSMAGVPGLVCPECGWEGAREAVLRKARPKRLALVLGALMLLVAAGIGLHARMTTRQNGWWSVAPRSVVVVGYWATGADGALLELADCFEWSPRSNLVRSPSMAGQTVSTREGVSIPRWQRRLIAERAVKVVHPMRGISLGTHVDDLATDILAWCAEDSGVAEAIAPTLLRSQYPADRRVGIWIASQPGRIVLPDDPRVVGTLAREANDIDSRYREIAYRALATCERFQGEALVSATEACISNAESNRGYGGWRQDLRQVRELAGADAVAWLVSLLGHSDAMARRNAANELGLLGRDAAPALDALRACEDDENRLVRHFAARAARFIETSLGADSPAGAASGAGSD